MRLEFYHKEKLKREILKIVGRYLDLKEYQVFFFGSRISNKGTQRSDIDIGIEGKKEVPAEILAKIKEEVEELPTLYKIDIVDFKSVDKDFYKVAKKKIEIILKNDKTRSPKKAVSKSH
jgi:predicted nucleotidyltransferase